MGAESHSFHRLTGSTLDPTLSGHSKSVPCAPTISATVQERAPGSYYVVPHLPLTNFSVKTPRFILPDATLPNQSLQYGILIEGTIGVFPNLRQLVDYDIFFQISSNTLSSSPRIRPITICTLENSCWNVK
jgi:hypothetical protein